MRMKMYVFFTSLFLLPVATHANAPSVLWAKEYGGNVWCFGESVVETDDGGFIAAGHKDNFNRSVDDGIYVVRTDSNGDTLWTREYGGESDDNAYSIQKTKDGGFVIAGDTRSFGAGNDDVYIIRTDSKGDTLWTKTYGTKENDAAYSVAVTKDGGFILAGETTFLNSPSYSVYLVRTDSAGDTLWTKMYSLGDTSSRANSVIQTDDGGFALAGWIMGGLWGLFMRTDSIGNVLVKKVFTLQSLNANGVLFRDLKQTSDGGFILVGDISRPIGFAPGVLLVRTDPDGDTLWTKVYTEALRGYSVAVTEDEGFIVSASNFIVKTDSTGDSMWSINFNGLEGKYLLKSIQQTADGGFIAAGEGTVDSSGVDFIMVRIDKEGAVIKKEKSNQQTAMEGFALSGNYKDNVIYADYTIPYPVKVRICIYDAYGRLVRVLADTFMKKGTYTAKWKTDMGRRESTAGGVYFLRLSANGHTVSKKITIVK